MQYQTTKTHSRKKFTSLRFILTNAWHEHRVEKYLRCFNLTSKLLFRRGFQSTNIGCNYIISTSLFRGSFVHFVAVFDMEFMAERVVWFYIRTSILVVCNYACRHARLAWKKIIRLLWSCRWELRSNISLCCMHLIWEKRKATKELCVRIRDS